MSSTSDLPLHGFLPFPQDLWSIALAIASLAAIYCIGQAIYDIYFSPLAKFPGPRLRACSRIPYARSAIMGTDATDYVALHEQYGPVVRIAPHYISLAGGQQSWQDVYGFKKLGQPKPFKARRTYGKSYNGLDSIITADDADHSRHRKILSNAFSDKALKEQEPLVKRWCAKMRDKLMERAEKGEDVDMLKFYNCTTFDIMGDLTFGEGLNMLDDSEYSPWVKTIFESVKVLVRLQGIKSLHPALAWLIDEFLNKFPAARAKQREQWMYCVERVDRRLARTPDRPDLWTKILEKSEGPDGLWMGEHHADASIFMSAGTETTATALSGTTFHLLQNPGKWKRLAEEIRGAFGSFEDLHLDTLARQKYLCAVLQEGLRMYPPVPSILPRDAPAGGMLLSDGRFLPGGTQVGTHQLATYLSEKHFRHANEFHPERWLGDEEFKDDHLDALEPFSVGPRNCLGKNLAWHEMRVLLATVVLHFDMELCPEASGWNNQKVYILWEKKPLMCKLTPIKP